MKQRKRRCKYVYFVNATSSSSHWHAAGVETCPFRAFSIYIIKEVLLTLEDRHRAAKV